MTGTGMRVAGSRLRRSVVENGGKITTQATFLSWAVVSRRRRAADPAFAGVPLCSAGGLRRSRCRTGERGDGVKGTVPTFAGGDLFAPCATGERVIDAVPALRSDGSSTGHAAVGHWSPTGPGELCRSSSGLMVGC